MSLTVDITQNLVADAINGAIDAGKPLKAAEAGAIVGRKADQLRSLPGCADVVDTLDLAVAVAKRFGLTGDQYWGFIKGALAVDAEV